MNNTVDIFYFKLGNPKNSVRKNNEYFIGFTLNGLDDYSTTIECEDTLTKEDATQILLKQKDILSYTCRKWCDGGEF